MIGWGIAAYVAMGIICSRWVVGWFIEYVLLQCHQSELDGADRMAAFFIFVGTVLLWPVAMPVLLALRGIRRALGAGAGTWVRWFFTLDRNKRKELLK